MIKTLAALIIYALLMGITNNLPYRIGVKIGDKINAKKRKSRI